MASEEFLRGFMGGVYVQLLEAIEVQFGGFAPEIAISDVDEDRLAQAVYCAAIIQKHGFLRGKLGVISSRAGSNLYPGNVILYEVCGDRTATVHTPYSTAYIKSGESSYLYSTMINVPLGLIHPLKKPI